MVEDAAKKGGGGDGESIRVFVRVRPQSSEGPVDHATCLNVAAKTSLVMNSKPEPKVFTFDMVAPPETTQEAMFNAVGKELIDSCLSGYNGTIFAYGQTGSGKTFTMLGPSEDSENFLDQLRGIIPRSFEYLFSLIQRQKELHGDNVEFLCKCTFLEIYNENIFDMLDSASSHSLQLRENIKKGVFVDGLIEQTVGCAADAYQVLTAGWMNRTVASTSMNRESSRSHAVFSVLIESKELKNGVWNMKSSQMNLVDLAGSERQKDTRTTGLRLKEGCQINKSLSALGNVIMALVDITHGKSRFVPYRDSKLSFLLRDSLGGNAKTHIIACVHPGSKCFGETLSTLQFARRAKMIKNKAVINENATGSIEGLQQEIQRLKEQLLQYESGSIPPSVSGDGGAVVGNSSGMSGDEAYWKKCFLQAMYFVRKAKDDNKVLHEKMQKSEENFKRKDQALRQTKLVLKFRDEGLKKIERAQKEQRAELTKDEKDFIIESLRAEVKTLSSILDHHPDLPKVQGENDLLKQQLNRIQSQGPVSENIASDRQHSADLEKMYKDLLNEREKDGDLRTPSKESAVDVNGLKNQIEKLQADLETLRQQSFDEISKLEKTLVNKEAELVSSQTVREELERTLKSHHIRTQIERETTQQMHMDTIKTITTPQKAKYNLRNRLVLAPGSGSMPINKSLDFETSGDEELVDDIAPPPEYEEERVMALTDELQKQQEAFNKLKDDYDKREEELLKLVENTSRLESQKTQYEVLLTREQARIEDLQLQLSTENKKSEQLQEQLNLALGEVEDLRIMWKQSDKSIAEDKKQFQQTLAAKDSEISTLQTRCVQVEMDLNQTKHRLESSEEDCQQLRDVVENLQASVDFAEENLTKMEAYIEEKRKSIEELRSELQSTKTLLEEEQDKTKQLRTQLEITGDKEQELGEAYAQMDKLRSELKESHLLADTQNSKIGELVVSIREIKDAHAAAEKVCQERQETINNLIIKTDSLRGELKEKAHAVESLNTQLLEGEERITTQDEAIKQLEEKLQRESDLRQTEVSDFKEQLQRKSAEMDVLTDDLEEATETCAARVQELNNALQQVSQLETEVTNLKQQVTDKESELASTKTEWEEKLNAVEERIGLKDSAVDKLHSELEIKANEINRLRSRQNELAKINEQNTLSIMDKNHKIEKLKVKEKEYEELLAKTNMLQIENQSLIYQIEEMELKMEQRVSDLQDEVTSLRSLASHHDDEITTATSQRDRVRKEVSVLQDSVDMMCAELVETREMMERYQAVAAKDLEEKGKLVSDNEELRARALAQQQVYADLKAKNEELLTENATLSGHQNLNQRIHYVQNLKDTVIQAGEELRVTKLELTRCQALLKLHNISMTPMKIKQKQVQTPQRATITAPPRLSVTPQRHENKPTPLRPHNTNVQPALNMNVQSGMKKDHGQPIISQEPHLPPIKQEKFEPMSENIQPGSDDVDISIKQALPDVEHVESSLKQDIGFSTPKKENVAPEVGSEFQ